MAGRKASILYSRDLDRRLEQWKASTSNSYMDHMCQLDIDVEPRTIRNSGLICTIGKLSNVSIHCRVSAKPRDEKRLPSQADCKTVGPLSYLNSICMDSTCAAVYSTRMIFLLLRYSTFAHQVIVSSQKLIDNMFYFIHIH